MPKVIEGQASAQARDECEARGDGLGGVDEMLADEGFVIAESIGEHDRIASSRRTSA